MSDQMCAAPCKACAKWSPYTQALSYAWDCVVAMAWYLRMTATYVRVHASHYVFGQPAVVADPGPMVFRVHAYVGEDEWKEVTNHLDLNCLENWEDRVAAVTGWDTESTKFRCEVRYTYGANRKVYRMVLRHGDAFQLPEEKVCRIPRGILSAQLLGGNLTPGVSCDVLHRVTKYAGPRGDFHEAQGLHVRVQDVFPFDDQDQNCGRFEILRTIDTSACVRDYAYAENPVLIPPARSVAEVPEE